MGPVCKWLYLYMAFSWKFAVILLYTILQTTVNCFYIDSFIEQVCKYLDKPICLILLVSYISAKIPIILQLSCLYKILQTPRLQILYVYLPGSITRLQTLSGDEFDEIGNGIHTGYLKDTSFVSSVSFSSDLSKEFSLFKSSSDEWHLFKHSL